MYIIQVVMLIFVDKYGDRVEVFMVVSIVMFWLAVSTQSVADFVC